MDPVDPNTARKPFRGPSLRRIIGWTLWLCLAAGLLIRLPHEVSYWMLALAEKASLEGRTDEALQWVEQAKPWTAKSSLPDTVHGFILQRAGEIDELGRIDRHLQSNPRSTKKAELYLAKSAIFQRRGRWEDAIREFDNAANYQANLRPSIERFDLLLQAKRVVEAQREVDQMLKAAESDADKVKVYLGLSMVHRLRSRWQEALQTYDEAAALEPELRPSPNRLELLLLVDRRDDATEELAQLEQKLAKSREPQSNINNIVAYFLALIGSDLDRALQLSEQAVAADKTNAAFLDTRAYVQYRHGNHDLALPDAEHAVDLMEREYNKSPGQYELRKNLAVIVYHRSLVLDALEKSAEAERDRARVRELGFEPDERLF